MASRCQTARAISRGSDPARAFSCCGVASTSRGSKRRGIRRAGASPTACAFVWRSRKNAAGRPETGRWLRAPSVGRAGPSPGGFVCRRTDEDVVGFLQHGGSHGKRQFLSPLLRRDDVSMPPGEPSPGVQDVAGRNGVRCGVPALETRLHARRDTTRTTRREHRRSVPAGRDRASHRRRRAR